MNTVQSESSGVKLTRFRMEGWLKLIRKKYPSSKQDLQMTKIPFWHVYYKSQSTTATQFPFSKRLQHWLQGGRRTGQGNQLKFGSLLAPKLHPPRIDFSTLKSCHALMHSSFFWYRQDTLLKQFFCTSVPQNFKEGGPKTFFICYQVTINFAFPGKTLLVLNQ